MVLQIHCWFLGSLLSWYWRSSHLIGTFSWDKLVMVFLRIYPIGTWASNHFCTYIKVVPLLKIVITAISMSSTCSYLVFLWNELVDSLGKTPWAFFWFEYVVVISWWSTYHIRGALHYFIIVTHVEARVGHNDIFSSNPSRCYICHCLSLSYWGASPMRIILLYSWTAHSWRITCVALWRGLHGQMPKIKEHILHWMRTCGISTYLSILSYYFITLGF